MVGEGMGSRLPPVVIAQQKPDLKMKQLLRHEVVHGLPTAWWHVAVSFHKKIKSGQVGSTVRRKLAVGGFFFSDDQKDIIAVITPLGTQSRFGDNLLII